MVIFFPPKNLKSSLMFQEKKWTKGLQTKDLHA